MKVIKTIGFYFVSFTWGIVMSIIGLIIATALWICGKKGKRFYYCYRFEFGESWGGISLGPFIFTSKNPTLHTLQHEHGHSIQNLMLGILFPFIVGIPSGIRYNYRKWYKKHKYPKTNVPLKPYDSFFVEGWATRLGEKYFTEKQENENKWVKE